ncbi:hypothetical protein Trydic_g13465 [Trypoxylus dichotomus]
MKQGLQWERRSNANPRDIFNEAPCYLLKSSDRKYERLCNNLYLYFDQPDAQEIREKLEQEWKVNVPPHSYIEKYFTNTKEGLMTPTKAISFQHEAVAEWNRLTLERDVTIVRNESNIEGYLFGCILKNISHVIDISRWNYFIDNDGKLNSWVKQLLQVQLYKVETLRDLVIQLWEENKIPLLLKTDALPPVLKEFSRLKKRFIIIDSNPTNRCLDIESYKLSVFRHLGDVADKEMMKCISVSLQCREPTSLFEIIKDDVKLMESITCLDLINLMRPREAYLRRECLDGDNYMLFIIEKANSEQHRDDALRPNGANIVVYCKLGESHECHNRFRADPRFKSYKIFRLVDGDRLTLLPRIPDLGTIQSEEEYRDLERFFVDKNDESVYVMENGVIIPIIGEVPCRVRQKYIRRYLREGIKPDKENQGSSKQSTTKYGEKLLPEEDVLKESKGKVVVITGEPGMGKTTLLHSLFQSCDSKYYILFNDLARHQVDLRKGKLKTFQDLLRVSRDKYGNLPYKRFLDGLHDYVDRLVLILDSFDEVVATCKDQVVELVQNLEKISLQKIIIASRLTAADLLIGNVKAKTFKIEKFNQQSDKQGIADYWNFDISNFRHIPSEFLTTPLYLNMLKYISENETNLEVVNTWNLYETVVKLKMEDYCRRMEPNIPDDDEALSILLKHGELALKVLFGVNKVTKNFKETKSNRSNFIRLGLIVRYDNENPVFVHQTFVEFFVAKWLIENVGKDDAKYIYELILKTGQERILNIHSKTLPLLKAVLHYNNNEVLRLCEENKRCLLEMDGLGRSVLHLAVIFEYRYLNDLIRCMHGEGYEIYTRDKIMKWTWIDYLEKYGRIEKLYAIGYFLASQAYLNYCATHVKSLNYLLELKSFIYCYNAAIRYTSISLIRTLLSRKYCKRRTFVKFRDMCLHSPTCISRKHLDIALTDEKLDGTHLMCIYGNGEAVKTYIGSGVDFNKMDKFKCTPLHYSVMAAQNKEIIGLLLEKYGISNLYTDRYGRSTIFNMSIAIDDVNVTKMLLQGLNRRPSDYQSLDAIDSNLLITLLNLAIECGSKCVTEILLEYYSDVGLLARACLDQHLRTAIRSQQMEFIELLLQHGANPNSNDDWHFCSILELAIETKNENIVSMLLNRNADVNEFYRDRTPLTHAVEKSTRAIVELLLRNGADVNYADERKETPVMYAIEKKHGKDILQLLLNFNADVNVENEDGETPLGMAIGDKKLEIIEILLQNGARVNRVDSSGWTLLIHAVQREDDYAVRILLNLNADVNIKGEDGVTPLCTAVKTRNADIVQILLEKGADVNCFDGCGVSPLMAAIETGNTRLAKILLENKANVNLKNECGVTALYAAAFKRDVAMIELLMERGADSNIITMGADIFRNAKRKGNLEAVAWLLKNRPTTSNSSSETHAVAIIERVAEDWDGINLDDELRTLDPGHCDLVEPHSNSEDNFSSAICSLINAPSNGDVIDIFINNVANYKIVKLIERIRNTGNYNENVNCLKILGRYYEDRFQLLRTVIELDDYDISRCLLEDICLNELDKISDSLLCIAVHKGNWVVTDMLLKRGYAANKPDRDGFTPLMIAVCNGDENIANMLLGSGADVNFEANDSGLTALYIAALIDDRYFVNKLLVYGANKNINTSEDVFESYVKLLQLYDDLKFSAYCIFGNRNRVKDIIEEEANHMATIK